MSQLFDYFVCSRPEIDRWAAALEEQDDDLQETIEKKMLHVAHFRNLGQDDVNILAECTQEKDVDSVTAVGEIDLVRAISDEEGPWVMALRTPYIRMLAEMRIDNRLLERWVTAVARFNGTKDEYCRQVLTSEAAETLKMMCRLAVEKNLGVFVCFYG